MKRWQKVSEFLEDNAGRRFSVDDIAESIGEAPSRVKNCLSTVRKELAPTGKCLSNNIDGYSIVGPEYFPLEANKAIKRGIGHIASMTGVVFSSIGALDADSRKKTLKVMVLMRHNLETLKKLFDDDEENLKPGEQYISEHGVGTPGFIYADAQEEVEPSRLNI